MPGKLKLGSIVGVSSEPEAAIQKVKSLGLPTLHDHREGGPRAPPR